MTAAVGHRRRWPRRLLIGALAFVVVLLLAIVTLQLWPARVPGYRSQSYTAAAAELELDRLIVADRGDSTVLPECVSADLPARGSQRGTVLLFHGYTSCPHQFSAFAQQLSARGYRVLMPRMPGHGIGNTDREMAPLDLDAVTAYATHVTDLAVALDPDVIVGGLSGGAALALWLSEHRTDLHRVVAVAPFLSPQLVPTPLSRLSGNLLRAVPNLYPWWDSEKKDADQIPRYSYAKFSTHSIATLMTLGRDAASRVGTSRARTVYVLNAADTAIDEAIVRRLADRQRQAGEDVATYEFPATLQAPHEYVDDQNPDNKITQTFPTLLDLVTTGRTDRLAEQ